MILTVDIGNTNIKIGLHDNDELFFVSRFATDRSRTADQYAVEFEASVRFHGYRSEQITGAIIGSVVPELTGIVADAIDIISAQRPLILGPGVKTGLNIMIDDPSQLGADLCAGAVGAIERHKLPCIIIDLGTATKLMVVDELRRFRGGVIAPGVITSLNAISGAASLLPNISVAAPEKAIGTGTVECMQAGVVLGSASMIDGLTDRIEKELGAPAASIVATGGIAERIIPSCRRKIEVDPHLILFGLKHVYDKNRK